MALASLDVLPVWTDFYKIDKEITPGDMPEARGKAVQTTGFVDSDHAGDLVSRRSRTGVLCNATHRFTS